MFDRLGLAIRLREPWEAVDLGFILLRSHWGTVMAAWLAVVLPLSSLLFLVFRNHLWVPALVLWWLKPTLDRIVLHVLARATFGEVPSLIETLRSLPGTFRHGLAANQLWRRLSPQRSFVLPVWQLEQQPGDGYRKRCNILLRRGRVQAVLLTITCFLFQFVLFFSALGALSLFTPSNADLDVMDAAFGSGSDRLAWVDMILAWLPIIIMTILEPFYVAGGFSLYLNRRVELEGWDLEVSFRKASARITRLLGRSLAPLLLALMLLPAPALAAPAQPTPEEALVEVLRQPEFQVKQKKRGLRWKETTPKKETPSRPIPPELFAFFRALGVAAKWLIIAAAAAALVYVLWRNRHHLARRLKITSTEPLPETLFGMDIRPEALPAELEAVALRMWSEGRFRAALALLYRGALAGLVHRHRAQVSKGATEHDCLEAARQVLSADASDYFERLTCTWLHVAYAGDAPPPGSERLCAEWPRHFQASVSEDRR